MYEGDLKDGSFKGRGTLKFANGSCYEGDWKDGKFNGEGILKF